MLKRGHKSKPWSGAQYCRVPVFVMSLTLMLVLVILFLVFHNDNDGANLSLAYELHKQTWNSFDSLVQLHPTKEFRNGTELIWQVPESPKGVLFLAHGCNGTLRGKKDAATALFNLSIFHENKAQIVQAGAVKFLVQLMDPADGMVDKAVALLSNLSTIPEGRLEIAREGGIPLLVEIVESGTHRGKENAASIILQLCLHSSKFCTLVLQEGVVPPLVALSQSGTPRAKEKAQQLLSHFRNQREGATGKGKS